MDSTQIIGCAPVGRVIGKNDQYIDTLGDATLVYPTDGAGLRTCGACGHVRLSHVLPCVHCSGHKQKRMFVGTLIMLTVVFFCLCIAYLWGV